MIEAMCVFFDEAITWLATLDLVSTCPGLLYGCMYPDNYCVKAAGASKQLVAACAAVVAATMARATHTPEQEECVSNHVPSTKQLLPLLRGVDVSKLSHVAGSCFSAALVVCNACTARLRVMSRLHM